MKLLRLSSFYIICILIFLIGGCTANVNSEISLTEYDKSSSNIVIQYGYSPNNGELVAEFEKNPGFTLFGDGRLIYSEPLLFPMFMMPGYYGGPVFIYQPTYHFIEVMLTKDEVVGFIEYLNQRDFLNLDKLYDNNPSYYGTHKVTMNLKWKSKTVESIGNSAPQGLTEIINHLREYYNFDAKPHYSAKMAITCEEFTGYVVIAPDWSFPSINLDNLAGSVPGKVLEGQLKDDVMHSLTMTSRFFMFNGTCYVIYYKPLLPY
ncbi:MAG: hypothetical protein K8S87_08755 [Planctomycetes bacterium]|nr:hypothetical protein [Planctomycetota bacterium]